MKLSFGILAFVLSSHFIFGATVVVEPSGKDSDHAVVEFQLPISDKVYTALKDAAGNLIALQTDINGHASFQIKYPGKPQRLELVRDFPNADSRPRVTAEKDGKKLKFSAQGKPLMEYQAEAGDFPRKDIKELFRRGGYIHPVLSLSGKVITDDFPPNHIHHHGVWFAWSNAEFEGRPTDFWNMGDGKGRVEFVSVGKEWSGAVHAGFTSRHRYVDLTSGQPKTAIDEDWEVRIYNQFPGEKFWIFDLLCTQRCTKPIKFPEYRYGGIGLRGNWAWNGKDAMTFLTSDGITDRIKGHATRGRWCDMSGTIDGQEVGITILGHPDNFRAPQPMRLHPTEPFFNFAPQEAGEFEMAHGKPYVSRYRFVIHDGPPDKALLDRLWNAYATPPPARVE